MRDERIDLLRSIGLAMIILAHTQPPGFIFQLRNFDVPLMVIVAGMSFGLSFKGGKYLPYLWNRVKRLVFPVWLFLSIYFISIYLTGNDFIVLNFNKVMSSYLLIRGIGYVWVIRVFLLVAIVAPFIYFYSKRQLSNSRYLITLAASYLFCEIVLAIVMPLKSSLPATLFEYTIPYLIPYGAVFALGLRMPTLSRKQLIIVTLISFLGFITWACLYWMIFDKLLFTQQFKYPPRSYYLSYAVFISCLIWMVSAKIINYLRRLNILSIILFIGQNSIWIYLWHIPLVEVVDSPFHFKYLIVFISALLITYLQVKLVKDYLVPNVRSSSLKKNIRSLLTG